MPMVLPFFLKNKNYAKIKSAKKGEATTKTEITG